jgi:hypothetical protein
MKIITEDENMTVTIDDKSGNVDISSLVYLFRYSALAHGFHPDSVSSPMPDEHQLDEIIYDGIKGHKELDKGEELNDTTA